MTAKQPSYYPTSTPPMVILLHGLIRSSRCMRKMERHLQQAGFNTANLDYPSNRHAIDLLAAGYVLPQIREVMQYYAGPLHFVTHSLGGIMVRQLHATEPNLPIGRVVMLGPPNQGSHLVDYGRHRPLFNWLNGPTGHQLGTCGQSVPKRLGPAGFETGIIAGDWPLFEPFRRYFREPNDGKVSVASTRLEGMKDHLVLPVPHWYMMRDDQVIYHSRHFLQYGEFDHQVLEAV